MARSEAFAELVEIIEGDGLISFLSCLHAIDHAPVPHARAMRRVHPGVRTVCGGMRS